MLVSKLRDSCVAPGGGVSVAVLAIAMMAGATPAAAADQSENRDGAQEDIVVTATKRSESVQKVPIAMTAISAESIRNLGMNQSQQIAQQIPNLQIKNEFGISSPIIFMRGIGNTSFYANSINPVGVYVDNVYVGENIVQGFQIFDLERVEVLKGPQGTLFGRNTTGGLINFVSRKPNPSDGINGYVELTGGNFDRKDIEFDIGAPVSDTAALRFSFTRKHDDGTFRNVSPGGGHVARTAAYAGRLQFRWQPNSDTDILLNYHRGRSDGGTTGGKYAGFDCPAGVEPGSFRAGCTDPFGFGLQDPSGYHEVSPSFTPYESVKNDGGFVEMNIGIGGGMTLTSLSAYDSAKLFRFEDNDAHALAFLNDTFQTDAEFWSQELRLSSDHAGPFNWMVGGYYYAARNKSFFHFNTSDIFGGVGIAQYAHQKTDSYSGFADFKYELADRLTLRIGGRVTYDRRDVDVEAFLTNAAGVVTPPAVPAGLGIGVALPASPTDTDAARAAFLDSTIPLTNVRKAWTEWTGKVSLDYELASGQMVFASASRGFKGGEFNGGAVLNPLEVSLTNPEFVENYELGLKGDFFNRAVRINTTAFLMKISNQQVLVNVQGQDGVFNPYLSNVGASEIKGIETELSWKPVDHLNLQLGAAYLDAKFTKFTDPGTGTDYAGNRLPHAPRWSLNGLGRLDIPVGENAVNLQLDFKWVSKAYFSVENRQPLSQRGYALVNGRAGYKFLNEQAEISAYVLNMLDKNYIASAYDLTAFGQYTFQPGRRREYGVKLSYSF